MRGFRQFFFHHTFRWNKTSGLTVPQCYCACLIQQQDIDIPGCFHGSSRHGDHIRFAESIHSCDSDGRKQRTNGGGCQANEQGDEHRQTDRAPLPRNCHAKCRKWVQRHHDQQVDQCQRSQQDS